MSALHLYVLLQGLYQFGLNPEEWTLSPLAKTSHLVLVNKKDPEFKMIGSITNKKWKNIELLSL